MFVDGMHAMSEAGGLVFTPNLDHLRRLSSDQTFADVYEQADVLLPDGWPIVWLSRLCGAGCSERVTGADVVSDLLTREECLFLGGSPGEEDHAQEALLDRYPMARAAVIGMPRFERVGELDLPSLSAAINDFPGRVVFLCVGSPKQEYLAAALIKMVPNKLYFGAGASMDFATGSVRRAPLFLQTLQMEWVFRLAQNPRRLFGRYVASTAFLLRLICRAFVCAARAKFRD